MKIISYNIRGLGGVEKRSEVKRLVLEKKPFVICLQETKMGVVEDLLVEAMWGNTLVGFSFQSAIGTSGGLLTMWDCNFVQVWSTTRLPRILIIRGTIIQTNQDFVIANVYAPCDTALKHALWDQL
jgi:exonuclease III